MEAPRAYKCSGILGLRQSHPGEGQVSVWTSGAPEHFVMHIQQAISAIRQKVLKDAYDRLIRTKKECKMKLHDANFKKDGPPHSGSNDRCYSPGKVRPEMASVTEEVPSYALS